MENKKKINILFPLLIVVSAILLGLSYFMYTNSYSSYKDYEYNKDSNETIYYKLNFIATHSFDMFETKHIVWKKALAKKINVEYIVSILDFTAENLSNDYCVDLNKKFSIDNAILCVDTYYSNRGYHDLIQVEILEVEKLMPDANKIVKQKAQSAIYLIEDLIRLKTASSKNIDKVYEEYKELKNEIENELMDMKKKI